MNARLCLLAGLALPVALYMAPWLTLLAITIIAIAWRVRK